MDWIEKLLGLDLDGGDGSAETMIVLACVIVAGAVVASRIPQLRERVRNPVRRWSTLEHVPVKCDQQRNVLGFTETRGRATRD